MDNAFQELDYSDISAKNINKKHRNNSGINTKTRGGLIRLGSIIIISHQERILNIADEIVVVSNGSIKNSGKPDEMMKALSGDRSVFGRCSKQEALF